MIIVAQHFQKKENKYSLFIVDCYKHSLFVVLKFKSNINGYLLIIRFIFIHQSFSNLAYANNINFWSEGGNTNDSIKQQLQNKWTEIPDGYGLLKFSNNIEVYSGTYIKYDNQNGSALFSSPGYGIIRVLTVSRGAFDVQSLNNYDITHNRYVTGLPAGKYYLYGSEDVGLPEKIDFFCEIGVVNDSYKTIKLLPADNSKHYFYLSKCVYGQWQGWIKYSGTNFGGVMDVTYVEDCNNMQETGVHIIIPTTPNGPGFYGMLRHYTYPNNWKFQEAIEVNGLQRSVHRGWVDGVWGAWV